MLRRLITRLLSPRAEGKEEIVHRPRDDFSTKFESLLRRGEFPQAESLCREWLRRDAGDSRVWHALGRLQARTENYPAAQNALERSVENGGANADVFCDLANVIRMQGDASTALEFYRKALTFNPTHELSLRNLALEQLRQGDLGSALSYLERVLAHNPRAPGIHAQIASIYLSQENHEKALPFLEQARDEDGAIANIHAVLGATYVKLGKFDLGIASYLCSLDLDSTNAAVANNLGYLYFRLGRVADAIAWLERAVALDSEFPEALNNLAIAQHRGHDFGKVERSLRRALELRPNYADAHANLGKLLLEQGAQPEAEVHFRNAIANDPASSKIHSNLLLCLNYSDSVTREDLYRAHTAWAKLHGGVVTAEPRLAARFDTRRRLRIGYVSPDFVTHSVAFFFEPILREHNPDNFEIYCYSNSPVSDATTERLKRYSTHWRDIFALDDAAAAEWVRRDKIDILVDLTGHMAGNRLTLMAKKAAPIQVTYLGYPNTTGVEAIDYRLTDEMADSESAQKFYSEKLARLPRCFLCYQPPVESPAVERDGMSDSVTVNFAAFNNLAKVTEDILAAWATILAAVPASKLLLPGSTIAHCQAESAWVKRFEKLGIDPERIVWVEHAQSVQDHLKRYNRVDIALDTYPYAGATTTMDALWMGVPVVTLYGDAHVSRVGYSILSRLGLEHCATSSTDEYVAKACELAKQGIRSERQRAELRDRFSRSELLDAKGMATSIEEFYRRIWRDECVRHG